MKDRREPLPGDGIEDLLHQDQPLTGGKIRDPPTGQGKPLARGRGAVLRLRFEEEERLAPEIACAVRDLRLVPASHVGGGSDRISAGALRNMRVDPDHCRRAVRSGRNAWKTKPLAGHDVSSPRTSISSRSVSVTIPTSVLPSTTGRQPIFSRTITFAASRAVVVGEAVISFRDMTSTTFNSSMNSSRSLVVKGDFEEGAAFRRSRSVTIPTRRLPSITNRWRM